MLDEEIRRLEARLRAALAPPPAASVAREATRARVLAQMAASSPRRRAPRRLFVLATAVLASMGIVTGALAASPRSVPGDPAYPVKLASEEIRLALRADPAAKAQLHLKLSSGRLSEMRQAIERHRLGALPELTHRYRRHLRLALISLPPEAKSARQALVLLDGLDHQGELIDRLIQGAPPAAQRDVSQAANTWVRARDAVRVDAVDQKRQPNGGPESQGRSEPGSNRPPGSDREERRPPDDRLSGQGDDPGEPRSEGRDHDSGRGPDRRDDERPRPDPGDHDRGNRRPDSDRSGGQASRGQASRDQASRGQAARDRASRDRDNDRDRRAGRNDREWERGGRDDHPGRKPGSGRDRDPR